jgi:hypothetical protein
LTDDERLPAVAARGMTMADGAFDIYQTGSGYAAVTSPVQRQILDALRTGEKQLPELVAITGRSKPTLSSLHMKELLARELIEESPHPTDSRRKVYRLRAQRIGSSELPVAQLREAVQHYVSLSPLPNRIPIAQALDAIAHAPEGTPAGVLHRQAERLGSQAAQLFRVGTPRDLWMRLASFLESERMASALRIDLQHGSVELRPGPALSAPPERVAAVLAGFAQGVAAGRGLGLSRIEGSLAGDAVRLVAS